MDSSDSFFGSSALRNTPLTQVGARVTDLIFSFFNREHVLLHLFDVAKHRLPRRLSVVRFDRRQYPEVRLQGGLVAAWGLERLLAAAAQNVHQSGNQASLESH